MPDRLDRRTIDQLRQAEGTGQGDRGRDRPDTVRAPDVGFVRAERIPATLTTGFFQGPPDLAVEVISPNDRAGDLLAKVQDWLGAGCRVVWVVDPGTRTVSVYRGAKQVTILTIADELTGEDVVPEFRLPVAEIFAP